MCNHYFTGNNKQLFKTATLTFSSLFFNNHDMAVNNVPSLGIFPLQSIITISNYTVILYQEITS